MRIHWHRRDLRVSDNRGLSPEIISEREQSSGTGGSKSSPFCGLFVFDPAVLEHASAPRMAFLLDALDSLSAAYDERDGQLLIARGDPAVVVPAVADSLGAECVSWNRDYSGLARRRDANVRDTLADRDIDRIGVHDAVHHEPGSITTNDGDPYKVFTYFSKKWHDREKDRPVSTPDADAFAQVDPTVDAFSQLDSGPDATTGQLPGLSEFGFESPDSTLPAAGTQPARDRLEAFCRDDIYRYDEERDYPARECTSQLSADLKFGTIGIRTVYEATEEARASAESELHRESVREFQDQLAWREFYMQVLWDRPDVVTENYKAYEQPIEWRTDEEALRAWKRGETGYPIVDAGMRQLRAEAFMHNRVRMIVASFLTKDLLIDWREGYDWFRERLLDHDTANDNGGWQWAASTGTDAQPYFRIFNPTTQGERFDPDATYIKRYVPELADVPAETIHSWPDLDEGARRMHAPEYPAPIVDHSERREQAIAMFERARGE